MQGQEAVHSWVCCIVHNAVLLYILRHTEAYHDREICHRWTSYLLLLNVAHPYVVYAFPKPRVYLELILVRIHSS